MQTLAILLNVSQFSFGVVGDIFGFVEGFVCLGFVTGFKAFCSRGTCTSGMPCSSVLRDCTACVYLRGKAQ